MSVPYSAPPQQPGTPGQPAGVNLGLILPLAVTVLGLISYFCGFSSEFSVQGITPQYLQYLLAGAVLGGLAVLPKAGRGVLVAAAVPSVVGALTLLQIVINSQGSIPSIVVVVLIAGILQAATSIAAVLFDAEIIKLQPKPVPYGVPGGYGGFPPPPYGQQMGAYGQPGPGQPGGYGQPAQGQPGTYGQPGQPQQGQFGAQQGQPGTPPGGVGPVGPA